MIHNARRPGPLAGVLAGWLLAAAMPLHSWASSPDDPTDDSDAVRQTQVVRDFNRDGIADVARVTLHGSDDSGFYLLTVSLGQADGTSIPAGPGIKLVRRPTAMVADDFNQDGLADLIVGDTGGRLTLFPGNGRGGFADGREIAQLDSIGSIVVADFNSDRLPDLAVSDWRASSVKMLTGTAGGTFERGWSFPLRLAGTTPHLSVADFNGDHAMDLAVVYSDDDGDTFDVMLGDGHGVFIQSPKLGLVRDPNAHCVP